ncbi:hypothetical protein GALMADRAFT_104945 [Galerina marginata CBS 339.88]|uniref:FAD/NAD(P)-binding domain-containing protein n=1 Tax=Galerina marginata (strain CBS 339.88) TaxID=685588 RepID=A0A067SBU3_GALM3|nr:hypothetical protein GALMADRAFT_104945 [Galerina marginata CBS 339.88]
MVQIKRLLLGFLSSPSQTPLESNHGPVPSKSIAVVGAGSAGLAMLRTLVELEAFSRNNWEVVLYEERESVGGIWLPDNNDVFPPEIPKTPLYPLLRTNTPVPSMTYPGFPFPPSTPLYPRHDHVEAYHLRYARRHNLLDFIKFDTMVEKAFWNGTPEEGYWNLTLSSKEGRMRYKTFDHLVVATGNNHIPHIPVWKGQEDWLASPANHSRKIIHSVYYRGPEAFSNQTVLIVGNGGSGRDAATQILGYASQTFMSIRRSYGPVDDGVIVKPDISHFTEAGVVFVDGTILDPDVILLGTGYEMQKPLLSEGGELSFDPTAKDNSSVRGTLVTNGHYIFPLHRHIFSLSPRYPPNALAFIGLLSFIASCPSDIAQSLFAAHAILDPSILPPRHLLLEELASYEDKARRQGLDPYLKGPIMLNNTSNDYQDELVEYLKQKNAIPDDGKKFVEEWRREILAYHYLQRGWSRIEKLGMGPAWTEGVKTEAQWFDLMTRVNEWQKNWETENGIAFRVDLDLTG